MADYGFKTINKSNKTTGSSVVIEAKNPMLGFDLGKRPMPYVTFHVSDMSENPFAGSGTPGYIAPTAPTGSDLKTMTKPIYYPSVEVITNQRSLYGVNKDYGVVSEKIYEYEHKLGYKPAFYVVYSGSLSQWEKAENIGIPVQGVYSWSSTYGNSGSEDWAKMAAFDTLSGSMGGHSESIFSRLTNILGEPANVNYTLEPEDIPVASNNEAWYVRYAVSFNLSGAASDASATIDKWDPYWVEVDEKYIRIYRSYIWLETFGRVYYELDGYTPMSQGNRVNASYRMDARLRQKIATQTAGTELDITIMLLPYSLGDL